MFSSLVVSEIVRRRCERPRRALAVPDAQRRAMVLALAVSWRTHVWPALVAFWVFQRGAQRRRANCRRRG
jgi:hypothetical protein